MQNKFVLDIDDFGLLLPGLDDLLRIKKHYPGFKITCFTIPMPKEFFIEENQQHFRIEKYKRWAEIINSYSDWLEIGIHGFSHTLQEFDCKYQRAIMQITAAENLFKQVGLKYKKIFRAPYWQYSYDALNALKDKGYTVCLDRNNKILVPDGLMTYTYNWSFEEKLPNVKNHIKGHGHAYSTGGSQNPIDKCYANIIKQIPAKAEFAFVSEYLAEEEEKNAKSKENNTGANSSSNSETAS